MTGDGEIVAECCQTPFGTLRRDSLTVVFSSVTVLVTQVSVDVLTSEIKMRPDNKQAQLLQFNIVLISKIKIVGLPFLEVFILVGYVR